MATTAGGTPYVESSDLVANYPAVSLALAEHIDDLPAAILQVVRATDSTDRTTTSTSYVDVTGMSVTITPQKATSAILIIAIYLAKSPGVNDAGIDVAITDSSNNLLSGSELGRVVAAAVQSITVMQTLIAYSTPATTAATTYKLRFKASTGTATIRNSDNTGQLYAIEVSA